MLHRYLRSPLGFGCQQVMADGAVCGAFPGAHRPLRTSACTGTSPEGLLLQDGATAVPVADRYDPWAVASFEGACGVTWQTFRCCGPEAPLPARPPEGVPLRIIEGFAQQGYHNWRVHAPWTYVGETEDMLIMVIQEGDLLHAQLITKVAVEQAAIDVLDLTYRHLLRTKEEA
jgi:hypothetical protein